MVLECALLLPPTDEKRHPGLGVGGRGVAAVLRRRVDNDVAVWTRGIGAVHDGATTVMIDAAVGSYGVVTVRRRRLQFGGGGLAHVYWVFPDLIKQELNSSETSCDN
jgi:hypothetical protein